MEIKLRIFKIFLLIMLCTAPLYADQALVLTEIEQIQEKIWYLQRDLATQKKALQEQQKQLGQLNSLTEKNQTVDSTLTSSMSELIANRQATVSQTNRNLEYLRDTLVKLGEKLDEQNKTILSKTEKIGVLEGSLQALRKEGDSQQARLDQALTDLKGELLATRTELNNLQKNTSNRSEQVSLWVAGAAFLSAIMLTILFALRGRSKREPQEKSYPTKHEM
jgi:chromosome segregation ATPase